MKSKFPKKILETEIFIEIHFRKPIYYYFVSITGGRFEGLRGTLE